MKEFESRQLPDGEYEIKIDGVTLPETYPAEEIGAVYAEHWGGKDEQKNEYTCCLRGIASRNH